MGKHSRRVAVSVSDLLQEYIMQASPDPQVCTCKGSVGSNLSQTASGLRRLPHEKHWRPAVLSCLAGSTSCLDGSRRGGSCLVIAFSLISFLGISFLRKSSCELSFLSISFLWTSLIGGSSRLSSNLCGSSLWTSLLFPSKKSVGPLLLALHRSESQRQALILDSPLSEMS